MTLVNGTVVDAGGNPIAGATIIAELVVTPSFLSPSSEIIATTSTVSAGDGTWAMNLEPNDAIDPSNTAYLLSYRVNGRETATYIFVPTLLGSVWVGDLIVAGPDACARRFIFTPGGGGGGGGDIAIMEGGVAVVGSATALNFVAGDFDITEVPAGQGNVALAVDVARSTDIAAAIAALSTVYQPLNGDLTAIANLGTAPFGRNLLTTPDATALRAAAALGSVAVLAADTDTTLAANSDANIATQRAVKTYVDGVVTGLLDFKGAIDASANPNYPAALRGDAYAISVAGRIGGASGPLVDVGDMIVAIADNAGGTQAAVGASWTILEHNLAGALLAANNLSDLTNVGAAQSNLGLGTAALLAADVDGTLAANSDVRIATQKAIKTYTDARTFTPGANKIPYFDGAAAPQLNDITLIGRSLLAGNAWNDTKLLAIRSALGDYTDHPAKIAIIADSQGEAALSFNPFIADIMARYPSTSPSPLHIQGGFNGGNVLYPWTGSGTFSTGRGVSGHLGTLTAGQTLATTPVIAGDLEFGDRIRIHYLPNVGTFDVAIDGVTVATGVNTAAGVRDVPVTATTSTTLGHVYELTSAAGFTEDMVGSLVTHANLPAGTRIVKFSTTSLVILDKQAIAAGSNTATIKRPSWTSALLAKGPHIVALTGNSGTVKIDGIFYYNGNYNTQGGVQVHLLSQSGYTTADFLALSNSGTTAHVPVTCNDLQQYLTDEGFDAVLFTTCANDGSVATYQANMPPLIAATQATLPSTSSVILLGEPANGRAWMGGLSAAAIPIARTAGAALADMSTIAYDHSAQVGANPDQPYRLTVDGVHHSTRGAKLASNLLLGVIDGGVPRGDGIVSPLISSASGHVTGLFSEQSGTAHGVGVWSDINATNPVVMMGYWGLGPGFYAGDPAATAFAPDTYLQRVGSGAWSTIGGSIRGYASSAIPATSDYFITRAYLDKGWHPPVRVAAADTPTASTYANGTSGVGATLTANANAAIGTVDGQTMALNDRVLIHGRAAPAENGIYKLTQLGTGSTPYIFTRDIDFNTVGTMVVGAAVDVVVGTVYAGARFILGAAVATIGTDAITFSTTTSADIIHCAADSGVGLNLMSTILAPTVRLYNGSAQVAAGTALGTIGGFGLDDGSTRRQGSIITFVNDSNAAWTSTAFPGRIDFGSTATTSNVRRASIDSAGALHIAPTIASNVITSSKFKIDASGNLTMTADASAAQTITAGTTNGLKIGTAITQLLSVYGVTPVAQRANANQAAAPAGGTGAIAGAYDTAAHRDAMIALVNEIRTALVNFGIIKGSA